MQLYFNNLTENYIFSKAPFRTSKPLSQLGPTAWANNREEICEILNNDAKERNNRHYEESKDLLTGKIYDNIITQKLFNLLTTEQKQKFITDNNIELSKSSICPLCLETNSSNSKKKCVHMECKGMCDSCHELCVQSGWCSVCELSQELECPICIVVKDVSEMVSSFSCQHKVCWKCYGEAYQSGHPINKCTLCRKQFNEAYNTTGQHIFSSDV